MKTHSGVGMFGRYMGVGCLLLGAIAPILFILGKVVPPASPVFGVATLCVICAVFILGNPVIKKIITECRFLGGAFVVDKDNKVLGYYEESRWVSRGELEKLEARVVRHRLPETIGESAELNVGKERGILTVHIWVKVFVYQLQDYFNAFVLNDKAHSPEEYVKGVLLEFLHNHVDQISQRGEENVIKRYIDLEFDQWLGRRLSSVGLRSTAIRRRIGYRGHIIR